MVRRSSTGTLTHIVMSDIRKSLTDHFSLRALHPARRLRIKVDASHQNFSKAENCAG
jgi:hypothetical protein